MQTFADLTYIPKYFTLRAVLAFGFVMLACILVFFRQSLPLQWILFGLVEVFFFFLFSTHFTKRWSLISPHLYQKKLFRVSLVIRVVWVVFSYFYFTLATGQPFEYETGDAKGYHVEGVWLSGLLTDGKLAVYLDYIGINYSDMGYPFYLGLLYYFVGDEVLIPRLIKALLGAFTCVLVYKLGRNNFGESTGRIAGVLTMLLPNLIYYSGLHVKETEMVFLTVSFVYLADKLFRSALLSLKAIIAIFLLGGALFFFRTVLAVSILGSVAITILLVSRLVSTRSKKIVLSILMIIFVALIWSGPFNEIITGYLEASDQNIAEQMDNFASREGGNLLAKYGSRSLFLPFMLIAPFPTLVDTNQPNAMMLGGAMFTRNIYAFFVLMALVVLIRESLWRQHVLLLSVLFSYLFILASSGFALSERFHMPIVPFMLILAAFGISRTNLGNKKYFIPYLLIISIIIIGWNWFKMAGRELV
ncbi:glycosyltransferase family 39 protein [Dyadobacter alkalitolerans]|uniref:glycosyltransferase family 39 protein n=1 Tax=Dyadobacter alkalitolerans TaxID=492736 RepID=UPI000408DEA7|nr:glycosyltransferase family 39 protein [Dyadobacter alkalitolerans]